MKDDYNTNSYYLNYTFLFRKVGRMYFLNLGGKDFSPFSKKRVSFFACVESVLNKRGESRETFDQDWGCDTYIDRNKSNK